jgi:hypothetical protein
MTHIIYYTLRYAVICVDATGGGGGGAAVRLLYKLTCTPFKNRGFVHCNLRLIVLYSMLLTFDSYFLFCPDFLNFPTIMCNVTMWWWQMPRFSVPIGTHNHVAFDCKLVLTACRQTVYYNTKQSAPRNAVTDKCRPNDTTSFTHVTQFSAVSLELQYVHIFTFFIAVVTFSWFSTPLSIKKKQSSCFQLHFNACNWDNVVKWTKCHAFHQAVRSTKLSSLVTCPHLTTRRCICHEIRSMVYEIVAFHSMKAYRGRWGEFHSFFTSTRPLYPRGKGTLYPVGFRAGLYVIGNAFPCWVSNWTQTATHT